MARSGPIQKTPSKLAPKKRVKSRSRFMLVSIFRKQLFSVPKGWRDAAGSGGLSHDKAGSDLCSRFY
jgi:hypothetical protein